MTHSQPAGQQLTVDDLHTVIEELYNARAKWYNIGVQLRVGVGTLDAIRSQYSDPSDCLRETLTTWLKSCSTPTTWSKVAEALNSSTVGEGSMATSLKQKYYPSTPPHPVPLTGMTLLTTYVCSSAQSYLHILKLLCFRVCRYQFNSAEPHTPWLSKR